MSERSREALRDREIGPIDLSFRGFKGGGFGIIVNLEVLFNCASTFPYVENIQRCQT